jgi:ferredoxin
MLIEVTERCSGHGRCYSLSPTVFEGDEEGYNVAVGSQIVVPEGLEPSARIGVASCPEGALVIVEDRAQA